MPQDLPGVQESSTLATSYFYWIRRISQVFVGLSSNPQDTTLRIVINERENVSETKAITCCKLCSSSLLQKSDLLFALSQNFAVETIHRLYGGHYQANEDELAVVFEITNLDDNTTTILRLLAETDGGLKIIEKTRNKLRSDGVNAIMQITGIVEIKETMAICLKIHDFMYRLRAFSEIQNVRFTASVSGMNYSTEFFPDIENPDGLRRILSGTSHYFKDVEHDELDFTLSASTLILLPESLTMEDTGISFELMTACFDRTDIDDQSTIINLYFTGKHGLYECSDKISSSSIGSIFPFVRLGITVNDIDFHPNSNGLVTPDIVLLAAKPSNLPNSCMAVLRISCDKSEPKDTIQLMSAIAKNFETILSYNATVIQATFLYNMGRSLDRYFQVKTRQKLSSDLETGISLTVSSTRDIISISPNPAFREACFSLFDVDNEHSLGVAVIDKLMTIADAKEAGASRKRRYDDDENTAGHQV